jgi:hypothetical protein
MQIIYKLLLQCTFTLTSTTNSGQTDIITTVYLFVFYTCSTATPSDSEIAVPDTHLKRYICLVTEIRFFCKQWIWGTINLCVNTWKMKAHRYLTKICLDMTLGTGTVCF